VYFDGKSHRLFVMIDNFTSGLSLSLSLSLVGACRCILTFLTHVLVFEERRHCSSPFWVFCYGLFVYVLWQI
jgi:hypothetical protein